MAESPPSSHNFWFSEDVGEGNSATIYNIMPLWCQSKLSINRDNRQVWMNKVEEKRRGLFLL
jgi:hypothetical protein